MLGLGALLAGAWICVWLARRDRDQHLDRLGRELPDIELRDLADLHELAARTGKEWRNAPPSARDISLRVRIAGGAGGAPCYLKASRMRIDAADLIPERYAILRRPERHRPTADQPPSWWRGTDPGWGPPAWWSPPPNGRALCSFAQQADGRWLGEYVHFDPVAGWLHYWEFCRSDVAPDTAPPALVIDLVAQQLGRSLIAEQTPPDADGWLHVQARTASTLGLPATLLPPGLGSVDAMLHPDPKRPRYILTLHGVDAATAQQLLVDLPLVALAADTPAPGMWRHALPSFGGDHRLPSWFVAGPGPRWTHVRLDLASGGVERARWVAHDPARQRLLVWDWEEPEALDLPGPGPSTGE